MPIDDPNHLDLAGVVASLRTVRQRSLQLRHREAFPPKLPSRTVLEEILQGLATVLYPNRLGTGEQTDEGVDYYVGHLLESSLRLLVVQVQRELRFDHQAATEGDPAHSGAYAGQSVALVRAFATQLPEIRALLDGDLQAAFEGDPAARSVDEVLVCYPGIAAIIHHRLAHLLYALGLPLIARMIAEIAHSATGIDIHPGARIGPRFFIDHGTGVVIGETCIIGKNVRLYQAVTLGAKRFPTDEHGVLLKGTDRHPIVEDDVVIYAGATILGRITIGRGSSIGGNVWLTRSVPPESNITQGQLRNEGFTEGAGI